MLILAFFTILVLSTFYTPLHIIRLTLISILLSWIIFITTNWLPSFNDGLALFNDWLIFYPSNLYFINIIFFTIISLLLYNSFSNNINKFYALLVIANSLGLILFPLSNDLISLYILIELQSYSLYIMTGINNKSYNSTKAALLYFLMGGIASCIIILSSYYIYNITGTTNLNEIWAISYQTDITIFNYLLIFALLFKMGLAPLHKWSLSVYNYAPTYITAYISIVAKISIITFILTWASTIDTTILYIFFLSSLFIGAYKPLYEINIKLILAYSGILNFSYLLLTLIINNSSSIIGFYLYLSQYVITHILLFLIILIMGDYQNKITSNWSPVLYIHQLRVPNTTLIGCLIIALFSLIGLPPLPGFYAKLLVFVGALSSNYILESLLIVLFSVIATYYYANIIKVIIINSTESTKPYISPVLAYFISFTSLSLVLIWTYLDVILRGIYLLTL